MFDFLLFSIFMHFTICQTNGQIKREPCQVSEVTTSNNLGYFQSNQRTPIHTAPHHSEQQQQSRSTVVKIETKSPKVTATNPPSTSTASVMDSTVSNQIQSGMDRALFNSFKRPAYSPFCFESDFMICLIAIEESLNRVFAFNRCNSSRHCSRPSATPGACAATSTKGHKSVRWHRNHSGIWWVINFYCDVDCLK